MCKFLLTQYGAIVTKAGNWDFVALNIAPVGRHLARLGDVIVEESATSGLLLAF
jgi:hypothetical protein